MKKFLILLLLLSAGMMNAQKYADCIKAKEICKKGKYDFPKADGEGRENFEAVPTPCFMNGIGIDNGNAERNSTWIKFKVEESGSLKFKIKPIIESDDIDFVVYRLSSDNCDTKKIIRCCASGDQSYPSVCMGATGLRDGEEDYRENVGCSPENNGFLAPIKAKAGDVFVLLVSNVTQAGSGFTINFTGSCKLPCEKDEPKPEIAKVEPKPEVKKEPKVEPIPEVKPEPAVVEKTTPTAPAEIDGRKTVVSKTLAVKNRTISMKVWDNSIEDGDVISIYINGKKLYSNIELKNKPQEFLIKLEPGENFITAHAENFGRKEPNTAAISVNDGKKEQKLTLNATKNTEETMKITVE
jgi:hypothetical protein